MVVYTKFQQISALKKTQYSRSAQLGIALGAVSSFDHNPCMKSACIGDIGRNPQSGAKARKVSKTAIIPILGGGRDEITAGLPIPRQADEKPKITLAWLIVFPFGILVGLAYFVWTLLHFDIIF